MVHIGIWLMASGKCFCIVEVCILVLFLITFSRVCLSCGVTFSPEQKSIAGNAYERNRACGVNFSIALVSMKC